MPSKAGQPVGKALAGLPAQSSLETSVFIYQSAVVQALGRMQQKLFDNRGRESDESLRQALDDVSGRRSRCLCLCSCDGFLVRRLTGDCGLGRKRMSVKYESAQWWMPRHEPAMKDVASCDKPRGAASEL